MKPESKSEAVIVPLPRPDTSCTSSTTAHVDGTVSRGSETVPVGEKFDFRQLAEDLSRARMVALSAALFNEMLRNLQEENKKLQKRLEYYSDLEDYVVHVYPWMGDRAGCFTLHTLLEQAHTEDDRYVRRLNACGDVWCLSENCQGKGRHGE